MNTSKIEWLRDPITGKPGYTINPVKGLCPVGCSYCYARRMYKRYKWDESVRFEWSVANDLPKMKAGSKVFWGSTMELFGDWVDPEWMRLIMEAVKREKHLTHIFLTKRPENLIKWSPFPENCWVGVSATNYTQANTARYHLHQVKATVKFLSIEPLLSPLQDRLGCQFNLLGEGINWLIIGQQTPVKSSTAPKMEWIADIVEAADKAKIPVFLKNNLSIGADVEMQVRKLRQEFPNP